MSYDQETHAGFLERFGRSHAAVTLVSYWMRFQGWTVQLPPISEAPTADQADQHSDPGDLYISRPREPELQRLEVKRLTYTWTGAHDYPFELPTVCSVYSFHKIDPPPLAHFILNDAMTHAFIAPTSRMNLWQKDRLTDKDVQGRVTEYYRCQKTAVNWVKVPAMKGINAAHTDRFGLEPHVEERKQISVGQPRAREAEEHPRWAGDA